MLSFQNLYVEKYCVLFHSNQKFKEVLLDTFIMIWTIAIKWIITKHEVGQRCYLLGRQKWNSKDTENTIRNRKKINREKKDVLRRKHKLCRKIRKTFWYAYIYGLKRPRKRTGSQIKSMVYKDKITRVITSASDKSIVLESMGTCGISHRL